jgi:hypothetical protein
MERNMYLSRREEGLKLYRITANYPLIVEQEILAKNEDEANELFRDSGGLNYGRIRTDLVDENEHMETIRVEAMTPEVSAVYVGTVVKDEDSEYQISY